MNKNAFVLFITGDNQRRRNRSRESNGFLVFFTLQITPGFSQKEGASLNQNIRSIEGEGFYFRFLMHLNLTTKMGFIDSNESNDFFFKSLRFWNENRDFWTLTESGHSCFFFVVIINQPLTLRLLKKVGHWSNMHSTWRMRSTI